ncbi:ankyrin repeat domain-containing protein [Telmatobacter sp. DSM 110680]|uniref:Ankyrin repeat domain-containing protein n=1 Tax=Telmatobacter sp. DSM 110680 TaxID=3036704 RepID=A0AAU7DRR7_9BACT
MSAESPRPLPEHPNLRYLKDQAKAMLKAGQAVSLAEAQREIARLYGFASWAKLKSKVEEKNLDKAVIDLKQAIDSNDLERVKQLITQKPALHRAPIGYNKNGPLTWVAECRVPWEPPSRTRLAMAQWMIDNGSDVHQGGDGPLMRAALVDSRVPMMDLLVRNGADVNAEWNGDFPIILAPCETLEPASLQWLLDHGANPECARAGRKHPDSALDYVIGTYSRSKNLAQCIDILLKAGCSTRRNLPAVLEILRGRTDRLGELLEADSALANKRFEELDFGNSGSRRLTLRGGTLLHVAAEYGNVEAMKLLLERGAKVNARAELDESGVGGQTAIFHAASQFSDFGLPVVEFLVNHGADLSVSARLPGHYERPEEIVECTPLEYAQLFPGEENKTVAFLRRAQLAR